MKEATRKWHNDILSLHSAIMFETLLYPHQIITESLKSFVFEDDAGCEMQPLRGFIAMKETEGKKQKYFIEDKFYEHLPIRITDYEEVFLKEGNNKSSILFRPLNPIPFRIRPEQTFPDMHEFIDELANFEHTNPDDWTMLKICAVMGYVGKTFLGISSISEFGKSSIFEILHSITKKSPVFQPRSIPGILMQVTGDGNIVFDEVHQSPSDVKQCMENFTLQVAGNKPIYINGAMKAHNTKSKYDVAYQSITYLYNTYDHYKNPTEEFFDNFFSNNMAMDSRILKLKFEGKLIEKFDRDFDMLAVAEANKMFYMKVAKQLLWMKQLKLTNGYIRKFSGENKLELKGRHKLIYDELTWLIDWYAKDEFEYKKFIRVLDNCITSYRYMVGKETKEKISDTESVMDWDEKCKVWVPCSQEGCTEVECNRGTEGKPYCKKHLR